MFKTLAAAIISLICVFIAQAGEVYEDFPNEIKASEKYVFYSHGFIVEGDNPTPVSARWGTYQFPQIKTALSDEGYNLIAYHRAKGTDPYQFAKKLVDDFNALVSHGVLAENIYLIGFSRGGAITGLVSHYAKSSKLNMIILAGCGTLLRNNPQVDLYGQIYSIYETSDGVGSCQYVIDRSKQVTSFTEIAISTGKEHGAFYTPIEEWLSPVKNWIKSPK
ncbi:alpha/beta hydrolase family protein [Thalassotalea sp. ND16A]|uniref:alpha/beta hydrolase family protein n=1 Tax=Thalassotalea sp. ND16A TaxID=1535422 RepID=UPI00051A1816|nr:alpha/beta hydrolase [Thalassotalea sp. ND16A]KGJ98092.1 hypothetical protein ND16A_0897 [Thalassotalea sp. ND16A]